MAGGSRPCGPGTAASSEAVTERADSQPGVASSSAPRAAVAIVHWGDKRDTIRCLRSVAASAMPASPVLVIDNGTGALRPDEVRAVVADAVFVGMPENVGFAAAANHAIRRALAAGADHVMLINNDAVLLRDCLGELVRVATSGPRIAAVGAKVLSFTQRKRLWVAYGRLTYRAALVQLVGRGEDDGPAYSELREVDSVPGCSMLLTRAGIEAVGMLDDEFFAYHEDLDWCTRAREHGLRIIFAPTARVAHRGGASLAKNELVVHYLLARNTVLFARKHARPHEWMRLGVTIGGSLARDWARGWWRGHTEMQRMLCRGFVDGILRRDVPYEAFELRPARVAAPAAWDEARETIGTEPA
jgi:GT2 family glycosyltransferase